ncbi:hypothetical protein B0T10DRAFT_402895 [Thelonectria olida]|uniref:Zn(2)-C6 fungal-type domain-containing protein n=1 Tax=Thelonectria olida TaxID=1576542 RepID=A0A9P8W7L2_9HYPO|nr:hypothetical protein B0T10DRAFT_402895 [Thelonectria olida]
MVYCGKPSKGCSNCRERKIRCDQKEPSCGQCEKRQQTCPGYRNLVDLMFRDESSRVISKAEKHRSHPRKKTQTPDANSPSLSPRPVPSTAPKATKSKTRPPVSIRRKRLREPVLAVLTPRSTGSPSQASTDSNDGDIEAGDCCHDDSFNDHTLMDCALSPELQEKGEGIFFSRYVAADQGCQNYSFIYDVWKPPGSAHDRQDDIVTNSLTAVGLLGFAQVTHSLDTMTQSRHTYYRALQRTQTALRDPVAAIKDTTLLAVLILGTYEFVSGHSPQTRRAWQVHVNGAATLASMRGAAQFRTKAGIRMFIMLSQSVLISCIQSDLPMPQAMVDLSAELQPALIAESPIWRVVDPIYRALQVRYDIKIGKLEKLEEMVDKLSAIDDEFAEILSKLPQTWNYRRILLTRSDPRVLGRECHVYPGLVETTTWNAVRAIRMLVLESILEQLCKVPDLSLLPDHHRTRLAKTIKLLGVIGEAIVASVPQHFGVVSFRDGFMFPTSKDDSTPTTKPEPRVMSPPAAPDIRAGQGFGPETKLLRTDPLGSTCSGGQDDNAERFMTLASSSNTIIWPLYVLGMSWSCSSETKQYAIERLLSIHKETGLEQARIVAGMLQAKPEPEIACTSLLEHLPALPAKSLPDIV